MKTFKFLISHAIVHIEAMSLTDAYAEARKTFAGHQISVLA